MAARALVRVLVRFVDVAASGAAVFVHLGLDFALAWFEVAVCAAVGAVEVKFVCFVDFVGALQEDGAAVWAAEHSVAGASVFLDVFDGSKDGFFFLLPFVVGPAVVDPFAPRVNGCGFFPFLFGGFALGPEDGHFENDEEDCEDDGDDEPRGVVADGGAFCNGVAEGEYVHDP